MKNLPPVLVFIFAFVCTIGFSQKKSVVIGEMISRPNAILILNSPNRDQGFLLPQLSTAQRLSILPTSPNDNGLSVFDTTEKSFYYWNNDQWIKGLGNDINQLLSYDPLTYKLSLSNGGEVDLTQLKEIPTPTGQAGKYITTDGTTLSWATVTSLGDITSLITNPTSGLSGGVSSGDVSLLINVDNSSISINASNQLQLSTNGVTTPKISDGAITSAKLANTGVTSGSYGTATQVSQFTVDAQGRITNATNVAIAGAVPTGAAGGGLTGTYPNPAIANNAVGSAETIDNSIASVDILDGTIATVDLANLSVTSLKLQSDVAIDANRAVTTNHIQDNAITTSKISAAAVTASKLANTTVVAGAYGTGTQVSQFTVDAQGRLIAAGNVTIAGVAPGGVAGGDLTGTYPNPTITNNAVGSAELIDNSISSVDILDGTIATVDLANLSVTSAKLQSDVALDANRAVTTNHIQDNAITTSKINNAAVTASKLANTTVVAGAYGTATQVSQFTVDAQGRLTNAGNVTISGVAPGGVAGGDLTGTYPNPTIAANAVTSAEIADLSIATADLANSSVTALKLANTTVTLGTYGTATQVAQFTVDAQGRLTNAGNVTISGVAPGGVAGGDLTGTYPNPTIAANAVTSAEIVDGTITSADITDLTVATADLANGAVTAGKLANTAVTLGTYGTATQVPQFTVDAQGRLTNAFNVSIVAAGDVTGALTATTVAKIQGTNVSTTAPIDQQVLQYELATTQWKPVTVPGIGVQTSYYSVDPADFKVVKADKNDNHGSVIFDADNTFVTGEDNNKGEITMAAAHFPHGAALNQMIIYYWDNSPNNIIVSLLRKNLATGVNSVMNTWTSSVNSATILTQTTINFNGMEIIANDTYSYRVYVYFNFSSQVDDPSQAIQRIYGVRFRYTY